MTREELVLEWQRLNQELGECDPEDYDAIFEQRSEIEGELETTR